MKKILLLFFAFVGISALVQAQSIVVKNTDGNDISNTEVEKAGMPNATLKYNMLINNVTTGRISVKVKKVEEVIFPGSVNSFCFAGNCYPPFVFVSEDVMNIEAGESTVLGDFYGEYEAQGGEGISTITYVIFNVGDETDTAYVKVNYNTIQTSVPSFVEDRNFRFSDPFPNPASNVASFNFTLPGSGEATFVLRSITGSLIREERISGFQGRFRLDVSSLPEGIYLYSVIHDNQLKVTRKLVVRK